MRTLKKKIKKEMQHYNIKEITPKCNITIEGKMLIKVNKLKYLRATLHQIENAW